MKSTLAILTTAAMVSTASAVTFTFADSQSGSGTSDAELINGVWYLYFDSETETFEDIDGVDVSFNFTGNYDGPEDRNKMGFQNNGDFSIAFTETGTMTPVDVALGFTVDDVDADWDVITDFNYVSGDSTSPIAITDHETSEFFVADPGTIYLDGGATWQNSGSDNGRQIEHAGSYNFPAVSGVNFSADLGTRGDTGFVYFSDFEPTVVPEPSATLLMGCGLGLVLLRRRRS